MESLSFQLKEDHPTPINLRIDLPQKKLDYKEKRNNFPRTKLPRYWDAVPKCEDELNEIVQFVGKDSLAEADKVSWSRSHLSLRFGSLHPCRETKN